MRALSGGSAFAPPLASRRRPTAEGILRADGLRETRPAAVLTIAHMGATHLYEVSLKWTGNAGSGTSSYRAYSRDHEICAGKKPLIKCSSDAAFRGDAQRWSPEELLVASLSQCHMLWYLHLAADAGIVVTAYSDTPVGEMREEADGAGQFTEVILRPEVTVLDAAMNQRAEHLHIEAARLCFIARSVSFPVRHEPVQVNPSAPHGADPGPGVGA